MKNNCGNSEFIIIILMVIVCFFIGLTSYSIIKMLNEEETPMKTATVLVSDFKIEDISIEPEEEKIPITKIEVIQKDNTYNKIENEYLEEENNIETKEFYYTQLETYSKKIYEYLSMNKENLKSGNYTIDFGKTFDSLLHQELGQDVLSDAFQAAIQAFMYDNIDIFYIDISKMSFKIIATSRGDNTTYTTYLESEENSNYFAEGFNSIEDVNNAIEKLEKEKRSIVNSVSGMDEYRKVKEVHDIIINNLTYDNTLQKVNTHNIYGALIEHNVVCDGYAKALKYILDELNIPCILITGNATNEDGNIENHAWNYVKLDGNWYGIDLTWDDPLINGSNEDYTPLKYRYEYFLKGSQTFERNYMNSQNMYNSSTVITYPKLSETDFLQ